MIQQCFICRTKIIFVYKTLFCIKSALLLILQIVDMLYSSIDYYFYFSSNCSGTQRCLSQAVGYSYKRKLLLFISYISFVSLMLQSHAKNCNLLAPARNLSFWNIFLRLQCCADVVAAHRRRYGAKYCQLFCQLKSRRRSLICK